LNSIRLVFLSFFFLLLLLLSGCAYLPRIVLLAKDPLTAEEHNNLGVAYEREGKYELAIREYKKALDKNPSLITPLVNIGNTYFKQGNFEEAERYYLRVLKKDESSIEAANNLAFLYLSLNSNYEAGLRYLNRAIAYSHGEVPAYALDTLGALYSRLGRRDKAIFFLTIACKKAVDNTELLREIEGHLQEIGMERCPGR
jgi:tetratricopeptide (TPR) repeat protein